MRREIAELVEVSRFGGGSVLLAQGGGGNSSVKSADGATMWIKASGYRLAEVSPSRGYVETRLPDLLALLRDPAISIQAGAVSQAEFTRRVQATAVDPTGPRPSIETGFHAVLGRVVLHTHPVYLNAFSCMEAGREALAEAFAGPLAWVGYEPPGYALGVHVDAARAAFEAEHGRAPTQVVLENHGLIASGGSASEAVAATMALTAAGRSYFGPLPEGALEQAKRSRRLSVWIDELRRALERRAEREPAAAGPHVRPAAWAAVAAAADEPEHWLMAGPLIPDDAVYAGQRTWSARPRRRAGDWLDSVVEALPGSMVVALPGLGVALAGPSPAFLDAMEESLLAHVLTRRLIARRGRARSLPSAASDTVLAMESEKYRQGVAAASGNGEADACRS